MKRPVIPLDGGAFLCQQLMVRPGVSLFQRRITVTQNSQNIDSSTLIPDFSRRVGGLGADLFHGAYTSRRVGFLKAIKNNDLKVGTRIALLNCEWSVTKGKFSPLAESR